MERERPWSGWEAAFVRFKTAESGVSPVISTILMVAVTVVLAATAFVLVADVGEQSTKPAMELGVVAEDVTDELRVTIAGADADWKRVTLRVRDDGTGVIYLGNSAGIVNEQADTSGLALAAGDNDILSDSLPIAGGDSLFFCREAGGSGGLQILIRDEHTNTALGAVYTFGSLEACPI